MKQATAIDTTRAPGAGGPPKELVTSSRGRTEAMFTKKIDVTIAWIFDFNDLQAHAFEEKAALIIKPPNLHGRSMNVPAARSAILGCVASPITKSFNQ